MSYPGPPGVSRTGAPPSSLPPRPPTTKLPGGFKPAFAPAAAASLPSYSSAPASYGPSAPAPPLSGSYGAAPSTASSYAPYTQAAAAGVGVAAAPGSYSKAASFNFPQAGYQQPPAYYGASKNNYAPPPQILNPFPAPSAPRPDYDPDMAAQIAQWQSAYMPKDSSEPAQAKGPGGRPGPSTMGPAGIPHSYPGVADSSVVAGAAASANSNPTPNEKKKTVYRVGGGKKWNDDTLMEWDPAHLRLFVGNLAGETTDDSLLKAFARWKSVQKAKVVRDKRTTKSKGYGFVSFSDPDDFFQAAKEMNGKYIQSHPVVVHKAKTEIKPQVAKENRNHHNHKKGGKKGGKQSGSGVGDTAAGHGAYEPHLGPVGGAVTKPGQKTRGGLKLLG